MGYNGKHIEIVEPKEGYDLIADDYEQYHDHLTSFDKGFFLTLLPREGRRLDLVDLGAGDGRVYKLLKNKKYEFSSFTACDISEKFLQKHPGKIKKIICDLEEKLPLENGSIDLAFSFFVLEHIANLNTLFEEMERILRPGGKRIIGNFLQRREFVWKKNNTSFKIHLYTHRLQDIEKIGHNNLFHVTNYPIYEKGDLLGHIILCEKP